MGNHESHNKSKPAKRKPSKPKPLTYQDDIRKRAESKLRSKRFSIDNISDSDMRNVFHELQVHQIELEMQNEELRDSQEKLEESRSKYADLYDFAPVGYFTLDNNGLVLEANLTGAFQLDIDRSHIIKKPFTRFINREDQDAFFLHRRSVFKLKTRLSCEITLTRTDKSEFYAQLVSTAMKDSEDNYSLMIIAVMNLSERRMAEMALKESEERWRSMTENSADYIMTLDRNANIQFINRALPDLNKNDVIGTSIYKYVDKEYQAVMKKCFEHVLKTGKPDMYEVERKGADGIKRSYESRVAPIILAGKVVSFTVSSSDITFRKKAEEELIKYRNNLEELVEKRTQELRETYKELQKEIVSKLNYQSEALRSAELASIGELAAGVAHEINNPINGIINLAQILANKNSLDSKSHYIAETIIKESNRIAHVVGNLLSFARESKEKKERVPIYEIVEDTLALTEAQLRKEGIKLKIKVPSDLPLVYAQRQQIQQVFLNLISNARYAMNKKYKSNHKDKVLSIIGEIMKVSNKPFVRITFYDRGEGIVSENLNKVMNPFFTTKPIKEGTGLGLSISRGMVIDHGGTLTFESIYGKFTKAIIDLPVKE